MDYGLVKDLPQQGKLLAFWIFSNFGPPSHLSSSELQQLLENINNNKNENVQNISTLI